LSALHGTDIYNFGETLEKGVVDVLSSSGKEWLAKILLALNQGRIEEWRSLEKQYAKEIAQHLEGQSALLNQKASILSVIELIFTRSSEARIISFQDIATASHIPVNQVEHLLMKALALGLLKGRIDQISSSFNVSWVQPRVLSQAQITLMKDRLYTWRETVGGALSLMESQISPEILS
jgi:26S proteasome regulatory subunit N9